MFKDTCRHVANKNLLTYIFDLRNQFHQWSFAVGQRLVGGANYANVV